MTANITLVVLCGVLVGCGVALLLSRSLVRSLLGVLLMSNGVNIAFLIASGRPGRAPIIAKSEAGEITIGPDGISDPLPQAMVLTAIVITLAVTGFTLALAHRQWQLARTDDVADDTEDTRIGGLAEANDISDSDYVDTTDPHSIDVEPGVDADSGRSADEMAKVTAEASSAAGEPS